LNDRENHKSEPYGSLFYSEENLFDTLPIRFKPFEDESTNSWVSRLAHANCLDPQDLFSSTKRRNIYFRYEDLISNNAAKLISRTQFNNGLLFHGLVTDFGDHRQMKMFRCREVSYCPYCLRDSQAIYSKRKWEYRWNTHCEKHFIRLSNTCIHCHHPAPLYSGKDRAWKTPWGTCPNCSKSLAAQPAQPPNLIHLITKYRLSAHLSKVNQLVEDVLEGNKEPNHLSALLQLVELLEYNHKFLISYGLNPTDYICCENAHLYPYRRLLWLPPPSAMTIAWYILESRKDIFYALIDQGWIEDPFPH